MLIWKNTDPIEDDFDLSEYPALAEAVDQFLMETASIRTTMIVPDRYPLFLHGSELLRSDASDNQCTFHCDINEDKTSGDILLRGMFYRPDPNILFKILKPQTFLEVSSMADGSLTFSWEIRNICTPIEWEEML